MDDFGRLTSTITLSSDIRTTKDSREENYKRGSAWLITVNSNKSIRTTPTEEVRAIFARLRGATDIIFNDKRPDSHFREVWEVRKPLIESTYKVRDAPEVGTKYGKLHSHILVTWEHYGRIRMNYKRVIQLYKHYMCPQDNSLPCINNVYVNIKAMQMQADGYLGKGEPEYRLGIGDTPRLSRLEYLSPNIPSTSNNNRDLIDLAVSHKKRDKTPFNKV